MGRQFRYYMVDEKNIRAVMEAMVQSGFDVVITRYSAENAPNHKKAKIYYETRRAGLDMLYQMTSPAGLVRLHKAEYGLYRSRSDPSIEWLQARFGRQGRKLVESRLYFDTQYRDRYGAEVYDRLLKDFKYLAGVIGKLAPVTSIQINGTLYHARMDERTIDCLKNGYTFGPTV